MEHTSSQYLPQASPANTAFAGSGSFGCAAQYANMPGESPAFGGSGYGIPPTQYAQPPTSIVPPTQMSSMVSRSGVQSAGTNSIPPVTSPITSMGGAPPTIMQ